MVLRSATRQVSEISVDYCSATQLCGVKWLFRLPRSVAERVHDFALLQ
jgi:hypothetical protein